MKIKTSSGILITKHGGKLSIFESIRTAIYNEMEIDTNRSAFNGF